MPDAPSASAGVCILGVDPGSRVTGYGLVEARGQQLRLVDQGCIRTGDGSMPQRLLQIHQKLAALLERWRPQSCAVESVFVSRSAASALVLGQARGVILATLAEAGLEPAEYAPAQIKSALVGYGRAEKAQMQAMVCALLGLSTTPAADAADALGVAICHARLRSSPLLAAARRASELRR